MGSGDGVYHMTIGDMKRSGHLDYVGAAAGAFDSDDNTFAGTFQLQPDAGQDCASTPVTGGTMSGQVLLRA